MSINVDARGLACPQPVIATKKALEKMTDGVLTTIVDNFAAKENVMKFASANHCKATWQETDGAYYIAITKGQGEAEPTIPQTAKAADTVYLITQDKLGHGSNELGGILIKSFFFALVEKEPLPQTLLFINSGVFLTTEGSPVAEHLLELDKKGVQILSCGTCLDYYERKDKLLAGGISNMYEIVEKLSSAAKTIIL
ncbi:MAG: sulfurtransferase-like selenium metabolism protein YedF [Veillonellales bacterium]